MLESIAFLLTALLLGLKHSLDSDHLIAVSTIVSQQKEVKKSALAGAIWGLGHTTTLLVVGFMVLFFKLSLSPALANFFETAVGFVLIYLGVSLFLKIKKERVHAHIHEHDGQKHFHLHSHKETAEHKHRHKSFFVGLAHGLAGSAALMLMVLSTAKTTTVGLAFILVFGIGSVLGMAIFGFLASIPLKLTENRLMTVNKSLRVFVSAASIIIGLSIIWQTI